jgi:hypothetical protein
MLGTLTVVGLIIAGALVWFFLRTRSKDLLEEMMIKRRATSKLVSRAEYVEGIEKIPVAISLTADTFYYENPDLDASFELPRIEEIEYDDDLSTGRPVPEGFRALRLRSHGKTFDFMMPVEEATKWAAVLPPRRVNDSAVPRAV